MTSEGQQHSGPEPDQAAPGTGGPAPRGTDQPSGENRLGPPPQGGGWAPVPAPTGDAGSGAWPPAPTSGAGNWPPAAPGDAGTGWAPAPSTGRATAPTTWGGPEQPAPGQGWGGPAGQQSAWSSPPANQSPGRPSTEAPWAAEEPASRPDPQWPVNATPTAWSPVDQPGQFPVEQPAANEPEQPRPAGAPPSASAAVVPWGAHPAPGQRTPEPQQEPASTQPWSAEQAWGTARPGGQEPETGQGGFPAPRVSSARELPQRPSSEQGFDQGAGPGPTPVYQPGPAPGITPAGALPLPPQQTRIPGASLAASLPADFDSPDGFGSRAAFPPQPGFGDQPGADHPPAAGPDPADGGPDRWSRDNPADAAPESYGAPGHEAYQPPGHEVYQPAGQGGYPGHGQDAYPAPAQQDLAPAAGRENHPDPGYQPARPVVPQQRTPSEPVSGGQPPAQWTDTPEAPAEEVRPAGRAAVSGSAAVPMTSRAAPPADPVMLGTAQPAPQPRVYGRPASAATGPEEPDAEAAPQQPAARGAVTYGTTYGRPAQEEPPVYGRPAQEEPPVYGRPAQEEPPVYGRPAQEEPPVYGRPAPEEPTIYGRPAPGDDRQPFGQPGQQGEEPGGYGVPEQRPGGFGEQPGRSMFGGPQVGPQPVEQQYPPTGAFPAPGVAYGEAPEADRPGPPQFDPAAGGGQQPYPGGPVPGTAQQPFPAGPVSGAGGPGQPPFPGAPGHQPYPGAPVSGPGHPQYPGDPGFPGGGQQPAGPAPFSPLGGPEGRPQSNDHTMITPAVAQTSGPPHPGGPGQWGAPSGPGDPDQGRFDAFKPEPTPAAPEKTEQPVPQVRNVRVLAAVLTAAVLLLVIPLGIVWLVTKGDGEKAFSPEVGTCVKQSGSQATPANCGDPGAFTVVGKVPTPDKCTDPQQPHVVVTNAEGRNEVLCLKPSS
jgi:hypothetical protein